MTLVGDAVFAVLPELKDFQKLLVKGVSDAADKAAKEAKPVELKADTSQIESAFSRLGDLGRVIAGVAVVAALKHAIDTGKEWVSTVNRIARATGDSLEESSRLAFVLDRVGLSAENAGPLIAILNRNLQQGGANFQRYFDGATLAELRTASFSKQLPILSAAYQKLNVGQERTTFLFNTFGRAGQEVDRLLKLLPAEFAALADEAERFGLVLDETNAAAFGRFARLTREAEQASKGLQVQVGQLTLPVFSAFNNVMIDVLTTLTNLPVPVQTLISVFAIGAIGIGKYGQALQAVVQLGQGAVAAIGRIVAARGIEAAATAAATAAEVADTAASLALANAHNEAAAAAIRHGNAEGFLAARAAAAAATQGVAAATTTAVAGAGAAAVPAATAAGFAIGSAILPGIVAALTGAAIGTAISKFIIEPILDARERAKAAAAGVEDVFKGIRDAMQRNIDAAIRDQDFPEIERLAIASGDAQQALTELNKEGSLTPKALEALADAKTVSNLRDIAQNGGDVAQAIRDIVAAANDGKDTLEELNATVGDFITSIGAIRTEAAAADAALLHMQAGISRVDVESEAGTNILANYAQSLFEARKAAAEAAGAQFDVAAAIQQASADAIKAGDEFVEAEKKRAEAIADARQKLVKVIADSERRVDKAERALTDAIEDRTKRIRDAEEKLADVRRDSAKTVLDARERLRDFEIDSAERLADAERAVVDARKEKTKATTDARISVEQAQRSGDAEAENAARRELARALRDRSVGDSERTLAQEKTDRTREHARLEAEVTEARIEQARRIRDAQEDLAEVIDDTAERIQDARRNLADAQREQAEAIGEAREALEEASAEANRLADAIERALRAAQLLANQEFGDFFRLFGATGGFVGFEAGGDFEAGQVAVVGEDGPELVRFGRPGSVTSNDDLIALLRQLLDGRGTTETKSGPAVNIITGHVDERILANEVAFRIAQSVTN